MGLGAANRTLRHAYAKASACKQAQGELKREIGLAAGEALENPGVSLDKDCTHRDNPLQLKD